MSGHFIGLGVSVVMEIVDDQALLPSVLEPPNLSEEF